VIFKKKEGVSLSFTARDLNPKEAADGQSTFHFKCLFLHLMILTIAFHNFLKLITVNKMYKLNNESIFILIRMFRFGGSTSLSGCCGEWFSYTISGREKECIQKFISLFSAIWDQRQYGYKEKTYRQWLTQCERIQCHVCSAENIETRTKFLFQESNTGWHGTQCFKVYHDKLYLRINWH
jgi:hypothetical protein